MKLRVLGSSSHGNCYLLQGASETLIIECGVKATEVKRALNYDFRAVVGAVVSHSHADHSGYVGDIVKLGIRVLGLEHTLTARKVADSHYAKMVEPGKGYKLGQFKVLPFDLEHDVPCLGYHINHPEMGNLLFVTDTCTMSYRFTELNHILIEANYADDILEENIRRGLPSVTRPRLLRSHLALDSVKSILRAQNLATLQDVVLLHLSDGNSNERQFVNEIKASIGVPVHAADKGFELELMKL